MYDHPDFLVLVAAGNSGPGDGTVGSPATAKNAAAVGAAEPAYAALWSYGVPDFGPVVWSSKYSDLVLPAAASGLGPDVVGGTRKWTGLLGQPAPADACAALGATALKGLVALLPQGACGAATQAGGVRRRGVSAGCSLRAPVSATACVRACCSARARCLHAPDKACVIRRACNSTLFFALPAPLAYSRPSLSLSPTLFLSPPLQPTPQLPSLHRFLPSPFPPPPALPHRISRALSKVWAAREGGRGGVGGRRMANHS